MRRGLFTMLLVMAILGIGSPPAGADPVKVKVSILVIEATRGAGVLEERLAKLEKRIVDMGYRSAKVLDELNAVNIDLESSVSLEMPSKKQDLRVKVLGVTKENKIKLEVAIKGMKFETETEHPNGGTLLLVITKGDNAMMLGVTPEIQK